MYEELVTKATHEVDILYSIEMSEAFLNKNLLEKINSKRESLKQSNIFLPILHFTDEKSLKSGAYQIYVNHKLISEGQVPPQTEKEEIVDYVLDHIYDIFLKLYNLNVPDSMYMYSLIKEHNT